MYLSRCLILMNKHKTAPLLCSLMYGAFSGNFFRDGKKHRTVYGFWVMAQFLIIVIRNERNGKMNIHWRKAGGFYNVKHNTNHCT